MTAKMFDFYGYTSPTDGSWSHDGTVYNSGEDFRTVERYKEYLDAGMTILLLQHENAYNGEDFESSNTKLCMDNAYKAGIKKVIVADRQLMDLSGRKRALIGENADFASEQDFDVYIKELISPYISHPAFYGIQLKDEPKCYDFTAVGQVYRSLKRVVPNAFLQSNLLPMGDPPSRHAQQSTCLYDAYRQYLENYLDMTDGDSLCYDEYPFRRDGIIHGYCMRSLKLVADICKKRNTQMRMVIQSCSMLNGKGQISFRSCTEADMYWQLNLLIGLGVRNFGYFTYFTKQYNKTGHETFLDGASFINRDGTRTKMYYFMQRIHAEFQKFAPVILNYSYNGMRLKLSDSYKINTPQYLEEVSYDRLELIKTVSCSTGAFTVSELKGEDGYMYMLHNTSDPFFNTKDSKADQITVNFSEGFCGEVYFRGEKIKQINTNTPFTASLFPGDAQFIVLKKEK